MKTAISLATFLVLSFSLHSQTYSTIFAIVAGGTESGENGKSALAGLAATSTQRPTWSLLTWEGMPLRTFVVSRSGNSPKILVGGPTGILRPFVNPTGWQLLTDWHVTEILCLALDPKMPQTIMAGTASGFFVTENLGINWEQRDKGLPNRFVSCILQDPEKPDRFLIGTELGLYETLDRGRAWRLRGLPSLAIRSMLREPESWPGIIWVGTEYGGLHESYDGGLTFEAVDLEDERTSIYTLAGGGANEPIYAGLFDLGLYKSASPGEIWEPMVGSEVLGTVYAILPVKGSDTIYAGTHKKGVYRSLDNGITWEPWGLQGRTVRGLILGDSHWARP